MRSFVRLLAVLGAAIGIVAMPVASGPQASGTAWADGAAVTSEKYREVPGSRQLYVPPAQDLQKYVTIPRNPRGAPIQSWADALARMSKPQYRKELEALGAAVPKGCPVPYSQLVDAALAIIKEAVDHNYMKGECSRKECQSKLGCAVQFRLQKQLLKEELRRGTPFNGVTFGKDEVTIHVTKSLLFWGKDNEKYYAYSIYVQKKVGERLFGGKRRHVYARTVFSLIVRCRNTGLRGIERWEMEAEGPATIPAIPFICEDENEAEAEASSESYSFAEASSRARATAEATLKAEVTAQGGNVTIIQPTPQDIFGYTAPGQIQVDRYTYNAGGVSVQAVPRFNAKMMQFQQQQQSQLQELWNNIKNDIDIDIENWNKNFVLVPISLVNGG